MYLDLTPDKLYKKLDHADYKKSGKGVDWAIKIDQERKTIFVMYCGSNEPVDWKHNLNFPIKPYKKQKSCILVARGWGKAWKSANDEIIHMIESVMEVYDNYTVVVIGYSFGGAMAILCVEDLYFRTRVKSVLITFGCPKPIWGYRTRKYLRSCCISVHQFAENNDLVTLAPPFPGYKHVRKVKVGGKRKLLKLLFKVFTYHQRYGETETYTEFLKKQGG